MEQVSHPGTSMHRFAASDAAAKAVRNVEWFQAQVGSKKGA